jgi:hypothetical protein
MLALKTRRRDSWAPSSSDLNPCDSFLWGYVMELVYKPLQAKLPALKEKVRLAFSDLPESIVARAVYDMKKRFRKLLKHW